MFSFVPNKTLFMCRFYVCAASGFSFISVFVSVFVSEFFARILICKFIGIVWGVDENGSRHGDSPGSSGSFVHFYLH